jgi:hypothetical protein
MTADAPRAAATRRLAIGSLLALALAIPAAAAGRGSRVFHGVASHGQYVTLSISSAGATVSAARMRERCRPGGRHQLVAPNHLASNPIAIGEGGRFAKTIRRAGSATRYRGFVNDATVVVKVFDSADDKCDGGDQRFVAQLLG